MKLTSLLCIVTVLSMSISLYQVSAQSNVVINEVESNPSGDDKGNEWVELYNPINSSIDISGWIIKSTHGKTNTHIIPVGVSISAGSYYIIRLAGQFLDNEGESVFLFDSSGNNVDKTPALSDTSNNSNTWQRSPDGSTNWIFKSATIQSSNDGAKQMPSQPTPPPTPPPISEEPKKEQDRVSVAIKQTKKVTLLAVKNSGDESIFAVKIKVIDGNIKFVKAKGWDREKVDSSTVMVKTADKPILPNKSMIIIVLSNNPNSAYEWSIYGKGNNEIASSVKQSSTTTKINTADLSCKGTAACFTATVTKIVDGDTLDVGSIRIRLALTNTPERGQPLYKEATQFTATLCLVGSTVLIDEDDGQTEGSYDRMIAKVYCGSKILNAELLHAGLAVIDTRFCDESEFAIEDWAQKYGC